MKVHNECCCTCDYQRAALAHPVNRGFAKGRISEIIGWLCVMPDFDQPDAEGIRSAVFFESPHGLCEMYRQKVATSCCNDG
jgi:hypothetical protein